jgi:succinate-semialdehyde dehydrogenase / glutarate-semialdehyde dehydrogenase
MTEEILQTFETLSDAGIETKLQRATAAFAAYRKVSFVQRSEFLLKVADILEKEKQRLARLTTTEMGKLFKAAEREVVKSADICRYYATHGEQFLADEIVRTEATRSYIRYQPVGPILAVMPWNYPFLLTFRFAAPALMAGNVCLLKPAPNVPQCALAMEEIFFRAGFPSGAFQTLFVDTEKIGPLLDDPRVKAATVTGGLVAGQQVAALAARNLKKVVLELGGSDPFIVMPSADLQAAVAAGVEARIVSNGQSCIAAKRFIIAEPIADEFEHEFIERMRNLKVGDPMHEQTELGPLATPAVLSTLAQQVTQSEATGARLLTGGRRLDARGYFYEPTVLTDVPVDSSVYREEVFGPVASLFRVRNLDHALHLANDTCFGLGASVWTHEKHECERFIGELDAGVIFVNQRTTSDSRLPFGGVKQSGYGRESGPQGIREFSNIKSVWVD